jgi:hypothetical protein
MVFAYRLRTRRETNAANAAASLIEMRLSTGVERTSSARQIDEWKSKGKAFMQLLQRAPLSRHRRYVATLGVMGIAAASVVGFTGQPAAAASFPVPSPINVTNITFRGFDLQVGRTGAVKTFEYRVNGGQGSPGGYAGIIGTYKATIGAKANTDYSVVVREVDIHTGVGGHFSAPKVFHTPVYVAPPKPTVPGNLRATTVTGTAVTLAWSPSTDPGASALTYRYFLNGKLAGTGGPTGATVAVSPGTAFAIQVDALNASGVRSDRATVSVTTPGVAPVVSRPTAPTNLVVTGSSTFTASVNWDRSSDPLFANTDLFYNIYVDGVLNNVAGLDGNCAYCGPVGPNGIPGGTARNLLPQTTYTIGIAAVNPNGLESELTTTLATTTP